MNNSISLSSALTGIQQGVNGMQGNASQIASASMMKSENPSTLAESLIDLRANQHQVSASVKVLKAADDMIGTLLDIKA